MERDAAKAGNKDARLPGRGTMLYHALALLGAGAALSLTINLDRWSPGPLVVLSVFTILTVLTDFGTGTSKIRVSGMLIGLVAAVVLLGPAPAVLLGMETMVLSWLRTRVAGHYARNNLVVLVWYPLAVGVFFQTAVHATKLGPQDLAYYLVVL